MPRMITSLCVIAFTVPPLVADTACANDPMSEAAVHYTTLDAKNPKPLPKIAVKTRRDHGRPSPRRMNMVTILPGTFMMGSANGTPASLAEGVAAIAPKMVAGGRETAPSLMLAGKTRSLMCHGYAAQQD